MWPSSKSTSSSNELVHVSNRLVSQDKKQTLNYILIYGPVCLKGTYNHFNVSFVSNTQHRHRADAYSFFFCFSNVYFDQSDQITFYFYWKHTWTSKIDELTRWETNHKMTQSQVVSEELNFMIYINNFSMELWIWHFDENSKNSRVYFTQSTFWMVWKQTVITVCPFTSME